MKSEKKRPISEKQIQLYQTLLPLDFCKAKTKSILI